jgi:hypothetical protein
VNFSPIVESKMVRFESDGTNRFELIAADLVDEAMPWRHSPSKLAKVILDWHYGDRRRSK